MKRGNGTGSVNKVSQKTRKPWRARVTVGTKWNEEKQKAVAVQKTVGYYATKTEAMEAIANYQVNPYNLDSKDMTFSKLYELYYEYYVSSKDSSTSNLRTLKSAYSYFSAIYREPIQSLTAGMIETCILKATRLDEKENVIEATPTIKTRMKSLANNMLDYAVKNELCNTNVARTFSLPESVKEQKKENQAITYIYSYEEEQRLWKYVDKVEDVDMVLIQMYSGWRPQELCQLRIDNEYIENGVFLGGLKTEAGKQRFVPIHTKIKELVNKRIEQAKEQGSVYLFNELNRVTGQITNITYDMYRHRVEDIVKKLKLNPHRAKDPRHTFQTNAERCGIQESYIDLILGHEGKGVGNTNYNKPLIADLIRAMEQYKIEEIKAEDLIQLRSLDYEKGKIKYPTELKPLEDF